MTTLKSGVHKFDGELIALEVEDGQVIAAVSPDPNETPWEAEIDG